MKVIEVIKGLCAAGKLIVDMLTSQLVVERFIEEYKPMRLRCATPLKMLSNELRTKN
jgi:hypothetical protein